MCVPPESEQEQRPESEPEQEPQQPEEPQVPVYHEPAAPALEEKTPEEIDVIQPEGDIATLRCFATGYPLPTVSWKKDSIIVRFVHLAICLKKN